jgi:hypothetical protein
MRVPAFHPGRKAGRHPRTVLLLKPPALNRITWTVYALLTGIVLTTTGPLFAGPDDVARQRGEGANLRGAMLAGASLQGVGCTFSRETLTSGKRLLTTVPHTPAAAGSPALNATAS